MVEFALVIPVFLLILCGIMDFGFVLYSRMTVINAAREGARAATLMAGEGIGAITATATNEAEAAAAGITVDTAVSCEGGCEGGDSVTVTVSYDHHAFFPFLFGATIPVSSTVQMVMEETGTGS
jgi:Flp pilus assembly protein TadG